jgi:hypothetical protein
MSAASFCRLVAALVPDMFHIFLGILSQNCNFYFVKNNKIAINSANIKANKNIWNP